METKKYLTEENYELGKKKLKTIAIIILIVGLIFGGSIIALGLMKQNEINNKYSENNEDNKENKENLKKELALEKEKLQNTKKELEEKIKPTEDEIKKLEREPFTGFDDAYYARKDKIEELSKTIASDKSSIAIIDGALSDFVNSCDFDMGKNNSYTENYCALKNKLEAKSENKSEFNAVQQKIDSSKSIPYYMFGGFIIVASAMISASIYMFAKRREIMAFTVQQSMPIAKEGIDEMSPYAGKVVKEITKGIKEGLKDDTENK